MRRARAGRRGEPNSGACAVSVGEVSARARDGCPPLLAIRAAWPRIGLHELRLRRIVDRDIEVAREHVHEAVRLVEQGSAEDAGKFVMSPGGPSQRLTAALSDVLKPELDCASFDGASLAGLGASELEVSVKDPGQ